MKSFQAQFHSGNVSKRRWIKIICFFLWFHRLFGLTFGGLAIDSKGRISSNKFLKVLGYFLMILIIVFDIFDIIWLLGKHSLDVNSNLAKNTTGVLVYLMFSSAILVYLLKWNTLLFFNILGNKFFKLIYEDLKRRELPKINTKLSLVIIFWCLQNTMNIILHLKTGSEFDLSFRQFISSFNFITSSLYTWSFAAITWSISIYYSALLDMMSIKLRNNLPLKTGKA